MRKPTAMQAKAMELIKSGVSKGPAMRQAGYSLKTSKAPKQNLLSSAGAKTMIEQQKDAYARVGITPGYMAEKTAEWLEATKIKSSVTEPDKVVPDYETQLEAAKIVRQDWGLGQAVTFNQMNVGEMTIKLIDEHGNPIE